MAGTLTNGGEVKRFFLVAVRTAHRDYLTLT